jgi:ferredoxin
MGIVDWREDCSSCHNCVKRSCVYDFYRDEANTLREDIGYLDYIYQCKSCLSCVQDCTKGILTRIANPEYKQLGDEYFTPEIITTTWFQADTGRIPVSGAGYGGKFSGSGFDSMWTDMSEIVRPTRDGIHGREYINTSVDIGRKHNHLSFEAGRESHISCESFPLLEIPFPAMFEVIPEHWDRGDVVPAIVKAADQIGTLAVVRNGNIPPGLSVEQNNIVPLLTASEADTNGAFAAARMVMVPDSPDIISIMSAIKAGNEDQIVAVRIEATPEATNRAKQLAHEDIEVIYLVFDAHGREDSNPNPRHVRDVLREIHSELVKAGLRDQITLVASGGVALAEHVVKAIICGADLVAIDIPLLLALECRLCGQCEHDGLCSVSIDTIDRDYAVGRIVNLMGAWHQQLIEMLGAMGIREVRRLRGETGRCMFFEDLERDTFGRLFGKRKEEYGA